MARLDQEALCARCIRVSMQCLAVAIPLLLVHGPAHAATMAACTPTSAASLDQRLVAKADEGIAPLRRFVERTRTIFELDVPSAVQRVDRQRIANAANAACVAAVASR